MKNTRKLTGRDNEYRIRFGNYRIIYQVDDLPQIILITQVGHRKDVYK